MGLKLVGEAGRCGQLRLRWHEGLKNRRTPANSLCEKQTHLEAADSDQDTTQQCPPAQELRLPIRQTCHGG